MKTSKQVLKKLFYSRVEEACKSGLSFAFFDGEKMVSVATATTLDRYVKIEIPDIPELESRK